MKECENLATCGFFKKYLDTKKLACQGFIHQYCKGDKQDDCKRKVFKKEHGTPAPDDMLPNGMMIADTD